MSALEGKTRNRKYEKGVHYSPQTEFRPGISPANKLPVGSQTIRVDKQGKPRRWIKIAEPNKWVPNAQHVWGTHYGPIPVGQLVHHIDGDSLNDNAENLCLVTRPAHVALHRSELIAARPSLSHEKPKTCPDCHATWIGRGKGVARCETCRKKAHVRFNAAYRNRRAEAERSAPTLFALDSVEAEHA